MELILLVAGLVGLYTYYIMRSRRYTNSIIDISKVYEVMNTVLAETSADRFLILYTANGGGRPHVGAHLYASVLYEVRNANLKSVKSEFQRIAVDEEYIDLLTGVERNKNGVIMKTNEMQPSLLRSIYERDGISCSYVFKVQETKTKYYYASVQTTDRTGVMDIATLQLASSRLKTIFRRAK